MFGVDQWTIIKLVFFAVVLLITFLNILYKVFVRSLSAAEEERKRQLGRGKDPAKEIRDFLAEMRGEKILPPSEVVESALLGEEGQKGGEEPPGRNAPPEAVDEREPSSPSAGPPSRRKVDQGAEPKSPSRASTPPVERSLQPWPAVSYQEARKPQATDSSRDSARVTRPRTESSPPAGEPRHVHEYMEALSHDEAPPSKGETSIEKRMTAKYGRGSIQRHGQKPETRLPFGMTLRGALISQAVFGPPRCRQKIRGPKGGEQPRRPREEPPGSSKS